MKEMAADRCHSMPPSTCVTIEILDESSVLIGTGIERAI